MNILPHLYVLPITGPNADRGKTCYVCQLGSAPVIAAFIRPDSFERDTHIQAVEALFKRHSELQAFVVILSGPEPGLIEELRALAQAKGLTVPLTVVDPEMGLPDSLPINLDADITWLLYRGRHVERIVELAPDGTPKMKSYMESATPQLESLQVDDGAILMAGFEGIAFDSAPSATTAAAFNALDSAAAEMISRP